MPKVFSNKYDRKIASFRAWFKGKRAENDIRQEDIAKKMCVTQANISRKIKVKGDNQGEITYKDLLYFFEAVNATDEEIVRYMKM